MYRLHFALLEFRTFFVGFVLTFLFVVFGRFLYYFWGVDDSFHSVRGCLMILIFRVKAFVDNLWRDTIIFFTNRLRVDGSQRFAIFIQCIAHSVVRWAFASRSPKSYAG